MTLLFDQNISFRIVSKIANNFPEAKQVRQLGLENYNDLAIWKFAKDNNYTIVTFDSDFFDLSNFKGHPPKIIWLRFGNTETQFIAESLNLRASIIKDFINSEQYSNISCLEIK